MENPDFAEVGFRPATCGGVPHDLKPFFRSNFRFRVKTFLKMDILRCLTHAMIEREVRMHFVAYNLIRCVIANCGAHPPH
jgi:hypothetical protein